MTELPSVTQQSRAWYRLVKENATCIACAVIGQTADDNLELHHIDRSTKTECVGNLLGIHDNAFGLIEMLKCCPLCHTHHTDFHKRENSRRDLSMYAFQDKAYQRLIWRFHKNAFDMAPPIMVQAYDALIMEGIINGRTKTKHTILAA